MSNKQQETVLQDGAHEETAQNLMSEVIKLLKAVHQLRITAEKLTLQTSGGQRLILTISVMNVRDVEEAMPRAVQLGCRDYFEKIQFLDKHILAVQIRSAKPLDEHQGSIEVVLPVARLPIFLRLEVIERKG